MPALLHLRAAINGRWRIWTLALALGAAMVVALLSGGYAVDRSLASLRDGLRAHDASEQLHIAEIDAASLEAVGRWPWSRALYARLIDRLREAGARTIAFDIDFSAASAPADDAALAAALERAGGDVILPTFDQSAGWNRDGEIESLPLPLLREHAFLAGVNIRPDPAGFVTHAPMGVITAGTPRPSLSAMLARQAGNATDEFPIDFAIRPDSIPRHSVIDILSGRLPANALAGRDILVGATAVELGDRYPVPGHGVIPGVLVQALAAETLAAGRPVDAGGLPLLAVAVALALLVLRADTLPMIAAAGAASLVGTILSALAVEQLLRVSLTLVPAFTLLLLVTAVALARQIWWRVHSRLRHDEQSRLPNRRALLDQPVEGGEGAIAAALIADFDTISASVGSAATGAFIRRVAEATGAATVYRVEDRVLAWDVRGMMEAELETRLAALRDAMRAPVECAGRRIDARLTIGVARGSDTDRLVSNAASAAARAAETGEGWCYHQEGREAETEWQLSLMSALDQAIAEEHLDVVFQPKLDLASDRIVSVEALVRWNHPERGPLRPDVFIPLAEANNRIDGLTLYVIRRTMAQLAAWAAAGHPITGAVNISAKLLTSDGFLRSVEALLRDGPVDARMLTFEVTESAAMTEPEKAIAALHSFRELGVAISMDDYGTGQSTLIYLKQLPLSELKIDRAFVQFVHENRSDAILVRSTINLAHELGLKVVAEGVETAECLAALKAMGCDMAQGYLIARPLPARELSAMLGRGLTAAA